MLASDRFYSVSGRVVEESGRFVVCRFPHADQPVFHISRLGEVTVGVVPPHHLNFASP